MIETLKLFRFGNNRKVQARWVAVGFCIIIALIALNTLGIQPSVATSSFIGAAMSLVVNWVVSTIEEGKPRNTPKPLLDAAHEDLETVGYYRKDQVITVSVKEDKQKGDVVELFMESLLVPINGKALVKHQKVTATAGLSRLDDKYYYKVGDKIIPPQGEEWIERPTRDCLSIHYRINAGANFPIRDRHSWSSPVLDYRVLFRTSTKYSFEVGTTRPAGDMLPLNERATSGNTGFVEFTDKGPAFSTQGLSWTITRKTDRL